MAASDVNIGDLVAEIRLNQNELLMGLKKANSALDQFGRKADRTSKRVKNSFQKMNAAVAVFRGTVSALAFYELVRAGKELMRVSTIVDSQRRAFKTITGSVGAAAAEFQYLRRESNRLGQDFYQLSEAYKIFLAASKKTRLEGQQTRDIFSGITEAATALGLSGNQAWGALYAVQQMMSKGKISAEELRQQLGERLPGAVGIFAKAMGVSVEKFNDLLDRGAVGLDVLPKVAAELHKLYGTAAEAAGKDSPAAAMNKLTEAWMDFKVALSDNGGLAATTAIIKGLTVALNDLARAFRAMGGTSTGEDVVKGWKEEIELLEAAVKGYENSSDWNKWLVPDSVIEAKKARIEELRKNIELMKPVQLTDEAQRALDAHKTGGLGGGTISEKQRKEQQRLLEQRRNMLGRWLDFVKEANLSEVEYAKWKTEQELTELKRSDAFRKASMEERTQLLETFEAYRAQVISDAQEEERKEQEDRRQMLQDHYNDVRDMAEEATLTEAELMRVQTEREMEEYRTREGYLQASVERKMEIDAFYQQWKAAQMKKATELEQEEQEKLWKEQQKALQKQMKQYNWIFEEMTKSLEDFVTSGKMDFDSLVNSIVSGLTRIAIQQSIMKPIQETLFGVASTTVPSTGGGGLFDSIDSGISNMFTGIGNLFGFANGGSFPVNANTAVGSVAGVDNRLIAFRARDGEQVTVTKPGQGTGGTTINFNITTPDANSFMKSQGQLMTQAQTAMARAQRRNG